MKKYTWRATVWMLILLLTTLSLSGCEETSVYVENAPGASMQVLFTRPDVSNQTGGLDEVLADAIEHAQKSVDIAAFDFDLVRVTDALIAVSEEGARVRMVVDGDNADLDPVQRLARAGIPIVEDDRAPFMHNKFVVIDGYEVWTGSWNLTDNGTYRNDNNVLVVRSRRLAENYTVEFEEMFETQSFGVSSPDDTPYPQVEINGVLVENYFESEGDARARILELLNNADQSIMFMAFAFTDDDISGTLVRRMREGVSVQGVMEARNVNGTGADFAAMQKAGVDIWEDGNPYIMHHKVIIVDESILITGSYNFTASAAERNDENVVIVHSSKVAAQYVEEFQRVYQQARAN